MVDKTDVSARMINCFPALTYPVRFSTEMQDLQEAMADLRRKKEKLQLDLRAKYGPSR